MFNISKRYFDRTLFLGVSLSGLLSCGFLLLCDVLALPERRFVEGDWSEASLSADADLKDQEWPYVMILQINNFFFKGSLMNDRIDGSQLLEHFLKAFI